MLLLRSLLLEVVGVLPLRLEMAARLLLKLRLPLRWHLWQRRRRRQQCGRCLLLLVVLWRGPRHFLLLQLLLLLHRQWRGWSPSHGGRRVKMGVRRRRTTHLIQSSRRPEMLELS